MKNQPLSYRHFAQANRREFLKHTLLAGSGLLVASSLGGCTSLDAAFEQQADYAPSPFGYWQTNKGLPEFVYTADQDQLPEALWDPLDRPLSRRHFHMMGNRAIQTQVSNTGDIALFDESDGMRWLIYGDDTRGTGHAKITEADGLLWGSAFALRPPGNPPLRIFGPSYFRTETAHEGLTLERTILCPEGDEPSVLIRVDLILSSSVKSRDVVYEEEWALRPRFLKTWQSDEARDGAASQVSYLVERDGTGITAREVFASREQLNGEPARLRLEALAPVQTKCDFFSRDSAEQAHPVLTSRSKVSLEPGARSTLWFRIGRVTNVSIRDASAYFTSNMRALSQRLPQASSAAAPIASKEIPWHISVLTGGASKDRKLPGHTLNQASIYGYGLGANAAARDALQHALPLVYSEPDLALSVLRNTCAWGSPDGDLPYALDDSKQPITDLLRPSDQNLWALWLAAEYAAATGNLDAFDEAQSFHPVWNAPDITLKEHLIRQFRFLIDVIGRGARGHVRLLNADWNDMVLHTAKIDRDAMIANGGSVLNSAMASWVLGVFGGLMMRLGEPEIAAEAAKQSDDLREKVAGSWNGRWVDRAYSTEGGVVGRERCWLEVQPWAILCGAVSGQRARDLISLINEHHRAGSPLGARIIWPADMNQKTVGQGTKGGIWYSINMTLIWAAAKIDPELAWDEWRRLSLDGHVKAYPEVWEGTLSGPDAWNAPESDRPGRTWTSPRFSQQSFPVNNLHCHSQPVLAYLRLLGVEPNVSGGLSVTTPDQAYSGEYKSGNFSLNADGSGWINATGRITVTTRNGKQSGTSGRVFFE